MPAGIREFSCPLCGGEVYCWGRREPDELEIACSTPNCVDVLIHDGAISVAHGVPVYQRPQRAGANT